MGKKNLFDDDYMNWMILNPDLYGMENSYNSYPHKKNEIKDTSSAGDALIIVFLMVIITPFLTLKKLFTGENVDGTDIGFMIFGFIALIISIYIIYKLLQERKAKKAYQQYLEFQKQNKIKQFKEQTHHNVRTTGKYKATEDNSFKEK